MKGTGAGNGTGSGPSPNKMNPGKKQALKTGGKLLGKRLLGAALGPVGWAWTAYDVAKYAYDKYNDEPKVVANDDVNETPISEEERKRKEEAILNSKSTNNNNKVDSVQNNASLSDAEKKMLTTHVENLKNDSSKKNENVNNDKQSEKVNNNKSNKKTSTKKLTWAEAKKNDPNLSSYVAERKKHKKGSPEYKELQNKINAAYNVKKRH